MFFVSAQSKGLSDPVSSLSATLTGDFISVDGSVDILALRGVPQAIEVERKAEQEGLANLNRQAAAGGPRREFAFYRGEGGFDLDALAVGLRWTAAEQQIWKFAVGHTATLGRDDAT